MNHYANNNMILKYLLQMKEHQGENKSIVIGEDFIHVSLRKLKDKINKKNRCSCRTFG